MSSINWTCPRLSPKRILDSRMVIVTGLCQHSHGSSLLFVISRVQKFPRNEYDLRTSFQIFVGNFFSHLTL